MLIWARWDKSRAINQVQPAWPQPPFCPSCARQRSLAVDWLGAWSCPFPSGTRSGPTPRSTCPCRSHSSRVSCAGRQSQLFRAESEQLFPKNTRLAGLHNCLFNQTMFARPWNLINVYKHPSCIWRLSFWSTAIAAPAKFQSMERRSNHPRCDDSKQWFCIRSYWS